MICINRANLNKKVDGEIMKKRFQRVLILLFMTLVSVSPLSSEEAIECNVEYEKCVDMCDENNSSCMDACDGKIDCFEEQIHLSDEV